MKPYGFEDRMAPCKCCGFNKGSIPKFLRKEMGTNRKNTLKRIGRKRARRCAKSMIKDLLEE
jgi:hypothetical protein